MIDQRYITLKAELGTVSWGGKKETDESHVAKSICAKLYVCEAQSSEAFLTNNYSGIMGHDILYIYIFAFIYFKCQTFYKKLHSSDSCYIYGKRWKISRKTKCFHLVKIYYMNF